MPPIFTRTYPADPTFHGVLGHETLPTQRTSRRIAEITDGTSHTLVLAEDAGRNDHRVLGKLRSGTISGGHWSNPGNNIAKTTSLNPTGAWGFDPETMSPPGHCAVNCTNDNQIYSFHPGVAQTVFADGSVRSVNASTDVNVIIALMTRQGGEVVPDNSY